MPVLQIVCQNCGAKYKLPESFQGDKAKCKACAAVIDVTAQRGAEAAPKAAKPATARPKTARPSAAKAAAAAGGDEPQRSRSRSTRRAAAKDDTSDEAAARPTRRGAGGRRSRSAGAGDDGEGAGGGRRRRGAASETKKGVSPALIGGGLLVVALIVVGLVFALRGNGDTPPADENQTANAAGGQAQGAGTPAAATDDQTPPAGDQADGGTAAPDDADTSDPEADAKAAAAAEAAAEAAAAAKAAAIAAKGEITSPDQVFDVKSLPALEFPEGTSDELRDEIVHICDDIIDGGLHAQRGKSRLEEIGYTSLYGLVNKLREIDYFDPSASMSGYEINRLIEAMTLGVNVGYKPPTIGEDQPLKDVDWNAKIVREWQRFLTEKYPTAEKFEELRKARATRHLGGK